MNEAIENLPECGDIVKIFYDTRNRYKEVTEKDKKLKFSD
jgi:hypothetical protein